MAEIDDKAFNDMKMGDPDKYITGGAIKHNEYEMDMDPKEQREYLKKNTKLFKNLYNADPLADRDKLPYKDWLETLNSERIATLAEEYHLGREKRPFSPEIILSNDLMRQADRHWGGKEGFNAIRDMALGR